MRNRQQVCRVGWMASCAATMGLMLMAAPAHAAFLTGTFSGLAFDSERVQGVPMFGDFDGARVFGTFGFEAQSDSTPGRASLTFEVPGIASYDFSAGTVVQFRDDGQVESIEIRAFDIPFTDGSLVITGPPGSLALLEPQDGVSSGIDLATFDPASIVLGNVSAQFGQRRSPSGSVRVDRLRFDDFVAIPEPATLTLFGMGLLGAALWRRRRNA